MADADKAEDQKSKLTIFVSYAREDYQLVSELAEELKDTFSLALNIFIDKRAIEGGDEWRLGINNALDEADILLIVYTGQKKESHSFTGYEIGYFSHSIKQRPMAGTVKRRSIPLIIGDKPPSAVSEIQGIMIPKETFYLEVKPGDLSSEGKFMEVVADTNPFQDFLCLLGDALLDLKKEKLTGKDQERWNRKLDECAGRLYSKIFVYLRSCVYLERYPERKLIVRTASPPGSSDDDAIFNRCTIDFVGESFEMFGFRDRPTKLPWRSFMQAISPAELATQWHEGIRSLVSDALSGVPVENYAFVRSSELGPAYRLFVSLVRTYYSELKEIHIYIVEVAPTPEYGDTTTTKLARAVDIGLRYRSLFLEGVRSPFSPEKFSFWVTKDRLRPAVRDMWRELQHLLADARQSHLDDPELLAAIYGDDGHQNLDDLAVLWQSAEDGLSKLTHEVMATPDDKIMAMKPAIMAALREFCTKTELMNREYTARALRALNAKLTPNVAEPAQTPVRSLSA